MTTDVNPTAEPSAAAAVATPAAVESPKFDPSNQHTWSPEQREQWNKDGNIPEPPKNAQEAAPAKTSDEKSSEGQPKSAADAETAKQQEKKTRKPGEKLSADERIAELVAENKRLVAERERSRASATKPTTDEPAKVAAKAEAPPEDPDPFTWKGTPEEFRAARDTFRKWDRQQTILEVQRNQQLAQQSEQMKARIDEAKQRYEDFETVISPAVDQLFASAQEIPAVVQQALDRTPHLTDVLYVLGGDSKALADFIATSKADPIAAIQKLFFLEQEVAKELATAKGEAKGDAKTDGASEKEKAPAEAKPRAPKPLTEVGGRAATGTDPLVAAAQANDFGAFEAEQTRRMQASRR